MVRRAGFVIKEAKLLHLELDRQLGDIIDEEREGSHEAERRQIHEGHSRVLRTLLCVVRQAVVEQNYASE